MPSRNYITKMASDGLITGDDLIERLRCDAACNNILLLDCRSQAEYAKSHIKGAVCIFLPSLMLRRLKAGKLGIGCIIQNNEAKEKFNRLYKTQPVVLYDDTIEATAAASSVVTGLLFKKIKQDGSIPIYLLGGFQKFADDFPEVCEGQDADNDPDILGLHSLKIADDSAYGTCDSENDDLNSPHAPHVPVQVIPHLYLGNAKNSADLELLKEYGITYILNVTPNVPNKFEEDSTFKYMKIPISDHLSQNLSQFFPEAIAFIDEARNVGGIETFGTSVVTDQPVQSDQGLRCSLSKVTELAIMPSADYGYHNYLKYSDTITNYYEARNAEHGVLVHCLAGISRSVTITVAYLMQKKELTLNDAYDYVKTCKPNISPNFNFMGQLLDFQKSLGREAKCSCAGNCMCAQVNYLFQHDDDDHTCGNGSKR